MLPRQKLKQCFTCKNNLACWGLNEDVPLGKNSRDFSISSQAFDDTWICPGEDPGDEKTFVFEGAWYV